MSIPASHLVPRLSLMHRAVLVCRAVYPSLATAGLLVVPVGVAMGVFPQACLAALFALPLLVARAGAAMRAFNTPRLFVPAIRCIVGCHLLAVTLFAGAIFRAA